MRYRIGQEPDQALAPDQGPLTFTAALSFLIGIGFVYAGLRSRHYWMCLWGAGLSLWSIGYLVYVYLLN